MLVPDEVVGLFAADQRVAGASCTPDPLARVVIDVPVAVRVDRVADALRDAVSTVGVGTVGTVLLGPAETALVRIDSARARARRAVWGSDLFETRVDTHADVVALDRSASDLADVEAMFTAMREAGEVPLTARARAVRGDAYALPFADGSFDAVVAAEVLEHLPEDERAMAELVRVVRPGGLVAVTVPRWGPEKVCWALSEAYHSVEGGHVRIYRGDELAERLQRTGLEARGTSHTHALHAPYWWLKCAVGVDRGDNALVRAYHAVLVWDMMKKPWLTRTLERVLDPVIGKSLVLYLRKPETARAAA